MNLRFPSQSRPPSGPAPVHSTHEFIPSSCAAAAAGGPPYISIHVESRQRREHLPAQSTALLLQPMLSGLFEDGEDESSTVGITTVSDVFTPGPKPQKPAEPRAACNLAGMKE